MTSREDMAELGEELQPLAREEPAPRHGRRGGLLVAVGLGLGLAGVAAVHGLGRGAGQRLGATGAAATLQLAEAKAAPAKLVVEQDLGRFLVSSELPDSARPGVGGSVGDVAAALFDDVAKRSGLDKELTGAERRAFKSRFVSEMLGMLGSNEGVEDQFLKRARAHLEGTKPVMTEALAKAINERQSSFKVEMQDWLLDESVDSFNSRLIHVPFREPDASLGRLYEGQMPDDVAAEHGRQHGQMPESFDSAYQWSKCRHLINNPHNQGKCGSCWAFAAVGVMDSRLCIVTNGKFSGSTASLSRGYATSCAVTHDGCRGGWPHYVYEFVAKTAGIPSSKCNPYFGGTDYADHWENSNPAPPCPTTCDPRFPRSLVEDMFKPTGIAKFTIVRKPDAAGIHQLKKAIWLNGPVDYAFLANKEFMGYKSGVFNSGCGEAPNHAVQAVGWGTSWGEEYIDCLNSWGTGWGAGGKFRVSYCVINQFTIPGNITATDFPIPVPNWK